MTVVRKQRNSRMCYICGMDNPAGLRAQFYSMEDKSVMTPFRFRTEHQSFPGRVHGGLVSSMLDELGLRALWANGSEEDFGVTMSLDVKFRKPVPYEEDLLGRGVVVSETSKVFQISTEILDMDGKVLANAKVRYIKLLPQQISEGADAHKEMCYLIEDDVKEL